MGGAERGGGGRVGVRVSPCLGWHSWALGRSVPLEGPSGMCVRGDGIPRTAGALVL